MKNILLPAFFLVASSSYSYSQDQIQENLDSNNQTNHANSYSSGSLQNYQINNNNESRTAIGEVVCSVPSLDIGATGREGGGNNIMAYTSITIPLGTGTCKKAQETKLRRMKLAYDVALIEQNKKDILFKDRLSHICNTLSGTKHHLLLEECHGNTEGKHYN